MGVEEGFLAPSDAGPSATGPSAERVLPPGCSPTGCGTGYHCINGGSCVQGCGADADCAEPGKSHCDEKTGRCVECTQTEGQCVAGKTCTDGACTTSCTGEGGTCADGLETCCNGHCVNLRTNAANCGACDNPCNGTQAVETSCTNGACGWTCADGFKHCSGPGNNTGCETRIGNDVNNCGACGVSCNSQVNDANNVFCNAGKCDYGSCDNGNPFVHHDDCDGNRSNGCECQCGLTNPAFPALNQACCPNNYCVTGTCNTTTQHCQ
jgi:hypothetical protein